MKGVKEIWLMVEDAQSCLAEIEHAVSCSCGNALSVRKEKLKNLLEDIRQNLEVWLCSWDSGIVRKTSLFFLEKILRISERLGASYVVSGYSESYYIMDTIKLAENN